MFGTRTFTRSAWLAISLSVVATAQSGSAPPPSTSFGIAVRQLPSATPTFAAAARLQVNISIGHRGPEPLELEFPSGQIYDIVVYNDRGERIYVWSADKLFPAVFVRERVRERRIYTEDLPLPLAAGRYVVEAFLTTNAGPIYRATMPVEIKVR